MNNNNPFQPNNVFGKKDDQNTPPFNFFNQSNASPFAVQPNNQPFNTQANNVQFNNQTTANPFEAQPNKTTFGATPTASPFSIGQTPSSLFAGAPSGATQFPNTQATTTPFSTQQNTSSGAQPVVMPFGAQATPSVFCTQPNTSVFGAQQQPSSSFNMPNADANVATQTSSNIFGSNVTPANPFGTQQPGLFNQNSTATSDQNNTTFNNDAQSTTFSNLDYNKPNTPQDFSNQSSLMLSVKDNSLNLYNLTLQEILDRHSAILDANIKEFEKDAKNVFDRDLKLIRSKNNYLSIQKKITDENNKLDELSQVLEFFDQRISEMETGEVSDGAMIVDDFEKICAKFYQKIELFKDEQDEVLDLVNENYEIIENIDKKLDLMSQIRNIK